MSAKDLHDALLQPAVLQILRAAGYTSIRRSVAETLTDITSRYLVLLASRTAEHAYTNHNDYAPDVTDVRMAMQDCAVFTTAQTSAEEAWKEIMRKPLNEYPLRNHLRENEIRKRDEQDTEDVKEFITWVQGKQNKEIMRIAGLLPDDGIAVEGEPPAPKEDYLTGTLKSCIARLELTRLSALKKKHSKTGEESRFQGTVLGKPADDREIKIEGGPVESIEAWQDSIRQRFAKLDSIHAGNGYTEETAEPAEPMQSGE